MSSQEDTCVFSPLQANRALAALLSFPVNTLRQQANGLAFEEPLPAALLRCFPLVHVAPFVSFIHYFFFLTFWLFSGPHLSNRLSFLLPSIGFSTHDRIVMFSSESFIQYVVLFKDVCPGTIQEVLVCFQRALSLSLNSQGMGRQTSHAALCASADIQ